MGTRVGGHAVLLDFLGGPIQATADDPAPIAWLREFLEPWFDDGAGPMGGAPDAPADAPVVHLSLDPRTCARLARDGGPASGPLVPCFLLDDRILGYPRWLAADGGAWIRDSHLDTWYQPGPGGVRILAPEDGRGARVALMRVVRELTMHRLADRGAVLLHAAGAARGGRALLVCGPRRAGKTTLLLRLLAEPGMAYLANDRVAVVPGSLSGAAGGVVATARGLPTIVALRPGTLALLPSVETRLRADRPDHWRTLAEGRAAGLTDDARRGAPAGPPTLPVDLSPAQLCALVGVRPAPAAMVAAVVFPVSDPTTRGVRLERLGRADALTRLRAGTVGAGLPRRSARGLAVGAPQRPRPRVDRLAGLPAFAVHLGPDAFQAGAVDPLLELLA